MVHEIRKRQKVVALVPGTVPAASAVYEEPDEQPTSAGYASSILNGNTTQGGLKSVTYKAVNTANLIENLYLVRNALIKTEYEALRVNDKDYATSALIEELRADNSKLNEEAVAAKQNAADDDITRFSDQLETQLLQKLLSKAYGDDLISSYQQLVADKRLVFVTEEYTPFQIDSAKLKVDKFDDVQNPEALAAAYAKDEDAVSAAEGALATVA